MTGKNTIPHKLRKSGKKVARKNQRRAEAEARAKEYDAMSDEEKATQREFYRLRYLQGKK